MEIPKKLLAMLADGGKEPQAHLDFALQAARMGVFAWDVAANKMEWDEELYTLFGLDKAKSIKNCEDFIPVVHPDDEAFFRQKVKLILQNKTLFEMEFRVVHSDSTLHYLCARGQVYLNADKTPAFVLGVVWDTTEHRLEEEKIKKAKEIAEESARLKTTFMARVSHDLRSPLNGIIGFAELMYHGKVGAISGEHKEYLGDILMSARQLLLLINDVVDLAKVEAGKMEFHPEKIDFKKILDETRVIFQAMIQAKKIKFETIIDPQVMTVIIDPSRLKQVIYNYVSNALKCTAEGGHVTLRILPNNKQTFRLEVEDNGIGIQPADLKRLFVEFQQLDARISKQYSGTGLGLALAKNIVEAQGGEVGATSVYGKGSTFFAILPLLNKEL